MSAAKAYRVGSEIVKIGSDADNRIREEQRKKEHEEANAEHKLNSLPRLRDWAETPDGQQRKEIMYCAKYWVREKGKAPRFTECVFHATDEGDARVRFWRSENERKFRRIQLVGLAPVVGYLVNDNHGDDLTV